MESTRIKIYTRSMNLALYNRAMFFVDLPYPKVRLTGTTADGYFYQMLDDTEADIIINIDEDAFVYDLKLLEELVQYVVDNEYVNCGMPDGGVVHLRRLHPLVTNAYFNILNVREIRKKFSLEAIQKFPFHEDAYMNVLPKAIIKGPYEIVDYEPYYQFFIWLSQNFKTLYLNAENHPDGESTILHDHLNRPFLIHTWYSRMYNNDFFHTKRINRVVRECELSSGRKFETKLSEKLLLNFKLYKKLLIQELVAVKKRLLK